MCCSGFLKIMMFIFNGGIFVSWKKERTSISLHLFNSLVSHPTPDYKEDFIESSESQKAKPFHLAVWIILFYR